MSKKYAGENTIQEVIAKTKQMVSAKQNALTFDDTPTNGSNNPVKSGGIYTALAGKQNTLVAGTNIIIDHATNTISATGGASITVDSALSTTSKNPVQNKIITEELNKKATMTLPTSSSFRLTVGSSTVIIQTGRVSPSSSNNWHTVTLPEAMPDERYILAGITEKNEQNNITMNIKNKTTTTFQVYLWANAILDYIAIYTHKHN